MCRDQAAPKAVEALKDVNVTLISGGWRHTVAADDAGNLYAWGWNKVLCLGLRGSAILCVSTGLLTWNAGCIP